MIGVVILFMLQTMLAFAARPAAGSFCPEVVRDYTAQLDGLPAIHLPPRPGHPPFAPKGVSVSPLASGNLVSLDVKVGARIESRGQARNGASRLDWILVTRLVRPYANEHRPATTLRTSKLRIGKLLPGDVRTAAVRVPENVGTYRWETEILSKNGTRLKRFGETFRKVLPSFEAKIGFASQIVRPGEMLVPCLENLGTSPVLYGSGYSIQYFDGAAWVPSPTLSPTGGSSLIGYWAGPGRAASRWQIPVPMGAASGLYRFAIDGEASADSRPQPSTKDLTPVLITGEFSVSP
jgi:hypothetical protein